MSDFCISDLSAQILRVLGNAEISVKRALLCAVAKIHPNSESNFNQAQANRKAMRRKMWL